MDTPGGQRGDVLGEMEFGKRQRTPLAMSIRCMWGGVFFTPGGEALSSAGSTPPASREKQDSGFRASGTPSLQMVQLFCRTDGPGRAGEKAACPLPACLKGIKLDFPLAAKAQKSLPCAVADPFLRHGADVQKVNKNTRKARPRMISGRMGEDQTLD